MWAQETALNVMLKHLSIECIGASLSFIVNINRQAAVSSSLYVIMQ